MILTLTSHNRSMSAMKRITEILDDMFRPMCPKCGYIPKNKPEGYCFYCEMAGDWCQCDVSDMCKCD